MVLRALPNELGRAGRRARGLRASPRPVMSQLGVGVGAAVPARVGMDDRRGQMRDFMEECVARSFGDVVSLGHRPPLIDRDLRFGVQPMADPTDADLPDALDSGHLGKERLGLVTDDRVDAIHDPHQDVASRVLEHHEDQAGDDQAGDRVGSREPECDTGRADDDRQRGEAVGSSVEAVCDERR